MIKLPNLDDQAFEDIVETSRRRVMQYDPSWTNFNPSDPGVTMLELFAWLKEMQQYRLNRITRESVRSCLRLLGIEPKGAQCAKTVAVFRSDEAKRIPEGFPFTAGEGGPVFETRIPVEIGDGSVFSVWISGSTPGSDPVEVGDTGESAGIAVQPFGSGEKEGACLYIGFFGVKGKKLRLYFEIDDKYPVQRTPFGDDTLPPRDIAWEFGPGFTPADSVEDETRGLSVSGEIIIDITDNWEASKPEASMPKCHWLRARLVKKSAEESPKIIRFFKDYAVLYQHETQSRKAAVEAEDKTITLNDYPGITGEHIVFSQKDDGWKYVKIPASRITIKDGCTQIKTNSNGAHRVVSVKPGFNALLSTKSSLPGIRLEMPAGGYTDKISLMIEDGGTWYDWELTEALYMAGPYDRVFAIEGGSIVFGDNEHGACPPAGTDNVLISDCRVTLGKSGNVLPGAVGGGETENITYGEGGADPESLEQALTRVTALLSETNRCVTRDDYEKIAAATPGTRIIKTRAVPGYDPKTGGVNIPALVTVVIQPYSASPLPLPDKRMLERVARHLEKGRLLTTRIEVAAPEYVPVSVNVSAEATDSQAARLSIKEELLKYLSPTIGAYAIGSPVTVSDITAVVSACRGVSRVISVTLSAPENMAPVDRSGNIVLPPHKIACPGEIEITVG